MADPLKFIFPIQTTTEVFDVVGYLPFVGAAFCAHRDLQKPKLWNVAHARTSLKLPIESSESQDEALDLAARLSRGCPSASSVRWDGTSHDGYHGKTDGHLKQLTAEVKAVLAA